jgi:uncharacterized membrane-anchored protein YhcB (DUF1043 family)
LPDYEWLTRELCKRVTDAVAVFAIGLIIGFALGYAFARLFPFDVIKLQWDDAIL